MDWSATRVRKIGHSTAPSWRLQVGSVDAPSTLQAGSAPSHLDSWRFFQDQPASLCPLAAKGPHPGYATADQEVLDLTPRPAPRLPAEAIRARKAPFAQPAIQRGPLDLHEFAACSRGEKLFRHDTTPDSASPTPTFYPAPAGLGAVQSEPYPRAGCRVPEVL
jgi:hypothetical protein